jgi:hypothetical protein
LIEVLLDESLLDQEDGEQDSPPTHAAMLLTEMRATEAIGPMIRAHARCCSVALSMKMEVAYPAFGASIVEPALALLRTTTRMWPRWPIWPSRSLAPAMTVRSRC